MKTLGFALLALCAAGAMAHGSATGAAQEGAGAAPAKPAAPTSSAAPSTPAAPAAPEALGKPLEAGDVAPDFSLAGSDGRTYRLSDFKGKRAVVIAWFPKAFTGG